jgi:hypothetical protein
LQQQRADDQLKAVEEPMLELQGARALRQQKFAVLLSQDPFARKRRPPFNSDHPMGVVRG